MQCREWKGCVRSQEIWLRRSGLWTIDFHLCHNRQAHKPRRPYYLGRLHTYFLLVSIVSDSNSEPHSCTIAAATRRPSISHSLSFENWRSQKSTSIYLCLHLETINFFFSQPEQRRVDDVSRPGRLPRRFWGTRANSASNAAAHWGVVFVPSYDGTEEADHSSAMVSQNTHLEPRNLKRQSDRDKNTQP